MPGIPRPASRQLWLLISASAVVLPSPANELAPVTLADRCRCRAMHFPGEQLLEPATASRRKLSFASSGCIVMVAGPLAVSSFNKRAARMVVVSLGALAALAAVRIAMANNPGLCIQST